MPKIKKILVANRGEIALRIMRTAREMGIKTVAVYSEADRNAPHVRFADEAVAIGPPASAESYLLISRILGAAKQTKADAVHPGYGFLAENKDFAVQAAKAKLNFIGPDPDSIKTMGNKLAAKEAVSHYDIPMVPGTESAITDIKKAEKLAMEIGFPVLIKAAAGGGGKGMRMVEKKSEFGEQLKRAISEAESAFGDASVFIERYIRSPRHIEIQVLGDKHGNIVHLFERECSIQRRHQKVIEEAPSVVLTEELRARMGEAAVNVARSCNYVGAGTVEFLLDPKMNFFFLEMNTRLQVEHPVTEMITGLDLVAEQIRIAEGKKLGFQQQDLRINGHAMELRVYAEDPENNFLPDVGKLEAYRLPAGPGVRVDDGYDPGMEIPIYYDPLISKLITYGPDRNTTRKRMIRAIQEYYIRGVQNTLDFGHFVMSHPAFISGEFDTNFVSQYYKPQASENKELGKIAGLLANQIISDPKRPQTSSANSSGKWKSRRDLD